MLTENRAHSAEAKMQQEARVIAEKDREAGWDQFFTEIQGKLHSLMDRDSRENRTSGTLEHRSLLKLMLRR